MRDGRTIGTYPIGELDRPQDRRADGRRHPDRRAHHSATPGHKPRLELDGLGRDGQFNDVNVSVRPGEMVGLYGLVGSGVSEIADCIYGIAAPTRGRDPVGRQGDQAASRRGDAQSSASRCCPRTASSRACSRFQSIAFNISAGTWLLSHGSGWTGRANAPSPRT